MGRPWNKECHYYFGKYKINKYMKISETFFSFYLDKKTKSYYFIFAYDNIFWFLGFFGVFIEFNMERYIQIISLIVYILFMFIFHFLSN